MFYSFSEPKKAKENEPTNIQNEKNETIVEHICPNKETLLTPTVYAVHDKDLPRNDATFFYVISVSIIIPEVNEQKEIILHQWSACPKKDHKFETGKATLRDNALHMKVLQIQLANDRQNCHRIFASLSLSNVSFRACIGLRMLTF
eukprot:CAMPEP_0117065110 /NCGR_PEP_ID=MMETSP0472-20121206/45506_1 /TAXON_ID=693140 ORGANISM="Tiarina fusus, Strain LIS" /NCGR_SAMPLE_ID=MMETSP0472 /ASSEMBLY_ACC=CAM_ASM_000603 /LENGTH=145 /DNA_ID=CAMNT_0004785583 /DNA_START=197 /DNA_END=634 /DNA_ORIENTATION=-